MSRLDELIRIAQILGKGFKYVRVDLYNLEKGIIFGEMTFTSLGGMIDFYTPDFLKMCGDKIDLSNISTKNKWSFKAFKNAE